MSYVKLDDSAFLLCPLYTKRTFNMRKLVLFELYYNQIKITNTKTYKQKAKILELVFLRMYI